jgi:hypothetical protein
MMGMEENFMFLPQTVLKEQALMELKKCNDFTSKFRLALSDKDIQMLVEQRFEALKTNGRVEFGGGILKKLIYEFCDSAYIWQDNFVATIQELQEAFYYFKNEALEEFTDDELIALMKRYFENECQGSLEDLKESKLEQLCSWVRFGAKGYELLDDDDQGDIYQYLDSDEDM